jgi:hypothetical protein
VVGQQHHADAELVRHLGQRGITSASRPGFGALAPRRCAVQAPPVQADRQAACRPSPRLALQVHDPLIGLGQQAVVHVQCNHVQTADGGCHMYGGVPKRRGIAAAADGHSNALPLHRQSRQRSLVSLKRP